MKKEKAIKKKFKYYIGEEIKLEPSNFEIKLFELILKADISNLKKLNKVYPKYTKIVTEYKGIYDLINPGA